MAIKIKTCAKVRRSPNYQAEETIYSPCRENLQFPKLITEKGGKGKLACVKGKEKGNRIYRGINC